MEEAGEAEREKERERDDAAVFKDEEMRKRATMLLLSKTRK